MSQLLSSNIWDRINRAVKRQPSKCHVAVAYFGSGASRLLPLKKGSTLIVDMSENAVRCGQTNPSEILKLMRADVEVHSVENLHAKVFAVGNSAFVGSNNVSQNSQKALVEAAVETEHPQLVRACRDFVRSLKGELITPAYAKRMKGIYRPPRHNARRRGKERNQDAPTHSRLWAVPLEEGKWTEQQYDAGDAGRPKAKKKLRLGRHACIDEFSWAGSDLIGRLRQDDLVIQVVDQARGSRMVSPHGRVLHIQHYQNGNARSGIVFVESPKRLRRKNQKNIEARLGRGARFLGRLKGPLIIRDQAFVHSLLKSNRKS